MVTVLVARRREYSHSGCVLLNAEIINIVSYCLHMFSKQMLYFVISALVGLLVWISLTGDFNNDLLIIGCCVILLSAAKIFVLLIESVVEGIGYLATVYWTRILSNTFFLSGFAYASIDGFGLWALVLALLAFVCSSFAVYLLRLWKLVDGFRSYANSTQLAIDPETATEIKRFRSQISLNWIASYGISNLPAPLAYVFGSPALAALVGVSTQFAAIVGVLCAGITAPRVSVASALAAKGEWEAFRVLFRSTLSITMGCAITATVAGVSGLVVLSGIETRFYSGQLPSAIDVLPYSLAASVYVYVFCVALFFRALQVEPFARQVFRSAMVTVVLVVVVAPFQSVSFIGLSQLVAVLILVLPAAVQHHVELKKKSGQLKALRQ